MRIALVGQPNCGKSTLFNQVAGYKAETGNFSGTSVQFIESKVRLLGDVITLVDLPGTYMLAGTNPAEREVINYLASNEVDVIINVMDASRLNHGLCMTLELLELGKPLILALNMIDEADLNGIHINIRQLEDVLGVKALPLMANRGRGVKELFVAAYHLGLTPQVSSRKPFSQDVELIIKQMDQMMQHEHPFLPRQAFVIKFLEEDLPVTQFVRQNCPEMEESRSKAGASILATRGQTLPALISIERYGLAGKIAADVTVQGVRRLSIRDHLDRALLHPFWGYIILFAVLYLFFQAVFSFGGMIEGPLIAMFEGLSVQLSSLMVNFPAWASEILSGLVQGISGGAAIVLPYLLPFLLGLGFLEDIGYLPRIAFLMDSLMHRLGLHGKAIVPFILGFGCNVPAIMSTRIMEDRRERILAAALATMVPCAARLAVVFGLVAFYLGPLLALVIYLFDLVVIALVARILSKMLPEDSPGLIMEMPVYRIPTLRTLAAKTWFRIKEFIIEAWPILIVGSVILALFNYFRISDYLNILVRPLSWVLGLPGEVGVPLIFGIFRKELSLVMLAQALGTSDFSLSLSPVQMMTYAVFVVFYIPCVATLAVVKKEFGWKFMWKISGLTIIIATLSALLVRLIGFIIA